MEEQIFCCIMVKGWVNFHVETWVQVLIVPPFKCYLTRSVTLGIFLNLPEHVFSFVKITADYL